MRDFEARTETLSQSRVKVVDTGVDHSYVDALAVGPFCVELVYSRHNMCRERINRQSTVRGAGDNMGLRGYGSWMQIDWGDTLDMGDRGQVDQVLMACDVECCTNKDVLRIILLSKIPDSTAPVEVMVQGLVGLQEFRYTDVWELSVGQLTVRPSRRPKAFAVSNSTM